MQLSDINAMPISGLRTLIRRNAKNEERDESITAFIICQGVPMASRRAQIVRRSTRPDTPVFAGLAAPQSPLVENRILVY